MIEDAIRDVTHRGEIVLDPFGGAGSTLLAAERCRRRARLIELEPRYVEVAIRRWEKLTGETAVELGSGKTIAERRRKEG
jgi:DNA modification methylase